MKDHIIEIDKIKQAEWSNLLPEFDDASIYQTWSYGAVRWGEKQLSHIIIKQKNEIIAAAQLRIIKIPLLKAGIAYLTWGPMWQRKGYPVNTEVFRKIINALKEEYAGKRRLLLRIKPNIIDEYSDAIVAMLNQTGFKNNTKLRSYRTLRLNLAATMAEIRKSLDQKWRNQLNRAEKNNLKIIEGNSVELYQIFLDLQKEMQSRKKYEAGVNYSEFCDIQKGLPEKLKMKILICQYEGKALTATIGSMIGDTGIYLLGAMGNEGMKMKGSYLLQWRLIEMMKEAGCRWYDLGGINPDDNPGVYHFKAGLSGKEVFHIGQYEICKNSINLTLVGMAEKMKHYVQKTRNFKQRMNK